MSAAEKDLDARASARAHEVIQHVLRGGLVLSFVSMAVGLALRVVGGHGDERAVRPIDVTSPRLDLGLRLMTAGILLLAVTPAVRVVALVVVWARERDGRFAGVAVVVAVVLTAAALLGG